MHDLTAAYNKDSYNEVLVQELLLADELIYYIRKSSANYIMNYNLVDKIISKEGKKLIKKNIEDNKIRRIVIYGAGVVGKTFFNAIAEENLAEVVAVVDSFINSRFEFGKLPVIDLDTFISNNTAYDTIIVTPVVAYAQISQQFKNRKINSFISVQSICK